MCKNPRDRMDEMLKNNWNEVYIDSVRKRAVFQHEGAVYRRHCRSMYRLAAEPQTGVVNN